MGFKRTSGALHKRIHSRFHKTAPLRALMGVVTVAALFAVFFGTAGADRIAVSAPPPHPCTT